MRAELKLAVALTALSFGIGTVAAQTPACPARPAPGDVVRNPYSVISQNGTLTVDLTMKNSIDKDGFLHDCVNYQAPGGIVESPTLNVKPGDQLILNLTNAMSANPKQQAKAAAHHMSPSAQASDPCNAMEMTALSTNVHFHGMNVPPVCHQDEVVNTLIQPGDPTFQYKIQIPRNEPPGLYWYHPHPHGFASLQVSGGAAGALIVGGIQKVKPEVAGLPSRVFVIRQQFLNAGVWLPGPNQLTINYQPAIVPLGAAPVISMKPGEKQFWRVANATTVTFLNLQIVIRNKPQKLHVVSRDGVPLQVDTDETTLHIPPAGRAEFIMEGPPEGATASFQTLGFDTGPVGDPNPAQQLASILPDKSADSPDILPSLDGDETPLAAQRFAGLASQPVTAKRKLYFSESTVGINGPVGFFLTVEGQRPKLFAMDDPPAVVTKVGAVEEWTIENRTPEVHAFHMHQIHFLVLAINGKPVANPELQDTVTVPYWKGKGAYPKVKVRLDFRDPDIAGTFVYHCHILDHEDGGMMQKIQVDP